MKKKIKKHIWAVVYSPFLVLFSVFTLLDAFVLPHDEKKLDETNSYYEDYRNQKDTGGNENTMEITSDSYVSENISIKLITKRVYDTDVYIADITVSDVYYLRTGLAEGKFGRNLTQLTSEIAEENGAVLAINGDYYGFRDDGFVVRNDVFYRGTARKGTGNEALAIYKNGSMEVVDEALTDAKELYEAGALQILTFGPGLIEDSQITVDENSKVEKEIESNPRTAIGMVEPLHYMFVVSDGRTEESAGLTLRQLAEVMQEAGCTCAYNLDGGGSTAMWFMGNIVNKPTTHGEKIAEREVSDIVYIGE